MSRYELPKSATPSDDWLVTPYGVVTFDTAVEAKALVRASFSTGSILIHDNRLSSLLMSPICTDSVNSDDELTRAWLWDPADPTTQVKVTVRLVSPAQAKMVRR